jgi:hypothetical protein
VPGNVAHRLVGKLKRDKWGQVKSEDDELHPKHLSLEELRTRD